MSLQNYRLINIDQLDPDSPSNFNISSLSPAAAAAPVSSADVQTLAGQVRQLLRGGDAEGALLGALENAPYGGDDRAKEVHLATVVEVLQSIKQSDMSPMLTRMYQAEGGTEKLDVLMKYLYKGMSHSSQASSSSGKSISPQTTGFSQVHSRSGGEGGGSAMSVLLSWHEKLVEIAGPGSIVRVMTDRRTV
ncbi:MAG: 40S ribosomal protein [Chaenotheca gracillima]|nr:MAG: 40S ribosomal protein [Chaenotheca gracillima]